VIALAVALVAVIAGQIGAVVWLVYGRIADTRAMASERVAHTATNGLLERAKFELEAIMKANTEQQRVIDGLEEVLAGYINATPNADLARNDVLSRLVRAANRKTDRDGSVSASAEGSVPAKPTADGAEAATVYVDPDALMQP